MGSNGLHVIMMLDGSSIPKRFKITCQTYHTRYKIEAHILKRDRT